MVNKKLDLPLDALEAAIEYADSRWSGVDVPVGWARHFANAICTPPEQPAPVQDQWLQAVTEKIEAKLLSHRLGLHDEANDAGTGYPLVDALSCEQADLEIGKQEVKAIAEVVFHVLAANTPPAAQPAEPLTFARLCEIEAEIARPDGEVSLYSFGRAIEAAHGITATPEKGN